MKWFIPVLALAVFLAAMIQTTTVFGGRFVTPSGAWCYTETQPMTWNDNTGEISQDAVLLNKLRTQVPATCEIYFNSPATILLNNSAGEVWVNGVFDSKDATMTNRQFSAVKQLTVKYTTASVSNGFLVSVTTPAQATSTPIPTVTMVPSPTATPLPSGVQQGLKPGYVYVTPTGMWCGTESNKLTWDKDAGRISVPQPILSQIQANPAQCEIFFSRPTNILLTNVAGQVWADGKLVSVDTSASKQPLLVKQLTVKYSLASPSNGFEILVNDQVVGRIYLSLVFKDTPLPTPTPTAVPARQAPLQPGLKYVKPTGMWCFDDKPDTQMTWDQSKGLLYVAEPLLTRVKSSAVVCEIFFDRDVSVILDNTTAEIWGNGKFLGYEMHGREFVLKQLSVVYKKADAGNGFFVLVNTQVSQ